MVPVTLPERHGRARVTLFDDRVVKQFSTVERFLREKSFYELVPWACPTLLDADRDRLALTVERLPVAVDLPDWRPIDELKVLLAYLFYCGVHHRDVHVKNIVSDGGAPKLIDWETAIVDQSAVASYDLVGPELSGVPKPVELEGYQTQFWGGNTRFSIARFYGLPRCS